MEKVQKNAFSSAFIVLGLIPSVLMQGVVNCPTDVSPPLAAHIFFVRENGLTFCSPALNMQDAVICFPQVQGVAYSITDKSGVLPNETCILPSVQNPCGEGYEGILVQLSITVGQGIIELISAVNDMVRSCMVTYNLVLQVLSRDLNSQTFLIPGMLVIEDMLFGNPVNPYTVCEVLENGTVVSIPVSVQVALNTQCREAENGSRRELSTARTITLGAESAFTQDRTATLFLTTAASCLTTDALTSRASRNFNVTFVNNTFVTTLTTEGPSSPSTPATDTIVVAVVVPLVVLVVVVLCIALTCLLRRRKPPADDGTLDAELVDSGGSYISLQNGNGHVLAPLSTQGIDDNDSGVGSPGPATPLKNNCVMIVCQNQEHPWYKRLIRLLGVAFQCQPAILSLPEDPQKLEEFKKDMYHYLQDDHVHHLLLLMRHGDSKSCYAIALNEVIKEMESRACDFSCKVWVVYFGAPHTNQVHSAIHRLFLTQTEPSDGLSMSDQCDQCATIIQKNITNFEQRPGGSAENLPKTASLVPGKFTVQRPDHLKDPEPTSWPMERKLIDDKLDKLLAVAEQIKTTGEETSAGVERTATGVERTVAVVERTVAVAERTAAGVEHLEIEGDRTAEDLQHIRTKADETTTDLQHLRSKADMTAETVQKTEAGMHKLSERTDVIQGDIHSAVITLEDMEIRQQRIEINDERKKKEDPVDS